MEQKAEYIWHNGEFVKWNDAKVHILTHGLHYGIGAFEGIRIYNGKPWAVDLHYKRLRESAESCGIGIEYSNETLIDVTTKLIEKNGLKSGYIRPITWLEGDNMVLFAPHIRAEIAIAAWPSFYRGGKEDAKQNPLKVTVSTWRKAPANSFPHSKKTTASYMMHYVIKKQAKMQGFDDALILNQENCITEATTSNVFFIKDGELITPEPSEFLLGITRQTVIDLARQNGIKVTERRITLDDLSQIKPDAAFLTGTAIELKAIETISFFAKRFDLNPQNEIFNQLLELFHNHVASN